MAVHHDIGLCSTPTFRSSVPYKSYCNYTENYHFHIIFCGILQLLGKTVSS
jgi:hypothetical protein